MPIFRVSAHVSTQTRNERFIDSEIHERYIDCSEEGYDFIKKELPQYEHSYEYGFSPEHSYTDHYRYHISRVVPFTNMNDLFDCIKKEKAEHIKENQRRD